jgi:hypothetical protein
MLVGIREREMPLERRRNTLKYNTKINLKECRKVRLWTASRNPGLGPMAVFCKKN